VTFWAGRAFKFTSQFESPVILSASEGSAVVLDSNAYEQLQILRWRSG